MTREDVVAIVLDVIQELERKRVTELSLLMPLLLAENRAAIEQVLLVAADVRSARPAADTPPADPL